MEPQEQQPQEEHNNISFDEALKILNIEDYKKAIINSNSHGELFHLYDYVILAIANRDNPGLDLFRPWFEQVVETANKAWDRPQSIYQHILKVFAMHVKMALAKQEAVQEAQAIINGGK